MFQTNCVEKTKTRVLCSITFISEHRAVYDIMWKKYGVARQATGDYMAHALCLLDS
jgi:hypothetical protein